MTRRFEKNLREPGHHLTLLMPGLRGNDYEETAENQVALGNLYERLCIAYNHKAK